MSPTVPISINRVSGGKITQRGKMTIVDFSYLDVLMLIFFSSMWRHCHMDLPEPTLRASWHYYHGLEVCFCFGFENCLFSNERDKL